MVLNLEAFLISFLGKFSFIGSSFFADLKWNFLLELINKKMSIMYDSSKKSHEFYVKNCF